MENEIQIGRPNRLIQKLFNMKGPVPSPQLAGDIMTNFILENDRPEWGFLSGESRFSQALFKAAVVGQFSGTGIFNGQSTGALIIVDSIVVFNNTAGGLVYSIRIGVTTGLANTVHPFSNDMRFLGKQSVAAVGNLSEAAATGQEIMQIVLAPNTTLLVPFLPVILPPNVSPTPVNGPPNVVVECLTANTALTAGFVWRERAMEQSEGPVPGA